MKKLATVVLSIVLLVVNLASCSNRNESENSESKVTETTATTLETKEDTVTTSSTTTTAETTTTTTTTTQKQSTTTTKQTNISDYPSRVVLPVKNIQQLPELPAGCEITSATIALNYYGFNVTKMEMLKYLPMVEAPDKNGRWVTPSEAFVGNPKFSYYGCYSPVIKKAINNYWEAENITGYEVENISNIEFVNLYGEIEKGNPVIIWASMYMVNINTNLNSWTVQDGSTFRWTSNEHCLVLIGFDVKNDTVILSDPWDPRGTVEYPRATVQKVYEQMGKQSLVIHKK